MSDSDPLPYSVGSKPHTVRIYRRKGRRNIYVRAWDSDAGRWRKRSLGHSDVEKAKAQAADLHAKIVRGREALRSGSVTLARLFALYRRHRSPQKGEHEQSQDARRIQLFTRFLGAEKDPAAISRREWDVFVEARSTGEIDARGRREGHPEYRGEEVRARTVAADLVFLEAVLNWATEWRTDAGFLLSENPVKGFERPQEKNPRRPVASDARVAAIRKVAGDVTMRVTWGGECRTVRSHLPALFDLAVETGRRLSAIRQLQYGDLLLESGPHGAIRWRADTDKEGRASTAPLAKRARTALDRHIRRLRGLDVAGIGEAPIFPAPRDPSEPVDRHRCDRWLRKAETLAELESQDGSLWHAYRRRWATVRKHLPPADVAKVGGWAGPETMQKAYQRADRDTMLRVVTDGGELRREVNE